MQTSSFLIFYACIGRHQQFLFSQCKWTFLSILFFSLLCIIFHCNLIAPRQSLSLKSQLSHNFKVNMVSWPWMQPGGILGFRGWSIVQMIIVHSVKQIIWWFITNACFLETVNKFVDFFTSHPLVASQFNFRLWSLCFLMYLEKCILFDNNTITKCIKGEGPL